MKTILKITISLLFIAASFTSCVDDKDFDTPQVACDDAFTSGISADKITSFENVVNNYVDGFAAFVDTDAEEIYFIAYVTSSDLKGNFYKEIYVQDSPENPSYGLKLDIDIRGMYAKYPIGSKLYIKLNGLGIEKSRGELTLGENSNESLAIIREGIAKTNIFRTCTVETIVAKTIASSTEIDETLLGKYIQLTNVQFNYSLFNANNEGAPFADPNDLYDTHRDIIFCDDNTVLKLETSSFAQYADTPLTHSKFDISGVLSRDYGDNNYVLKINSPDDIVKNDSGRCDPVFLDCGDNAVGGSVVIYQEDFESFSNNATTLTGWTNVNVLGGSRVFKVKSYSGNKYFEGSPYSSGENPLEMWAVTPAINLDSTTDEELTFKTKAHHDDGVVLSVYVSTDFTGDVTTATWALANANIGTAPSSTYGSWVNSGSINISCLSGDVYVAFKYEGGDGVFETGMRIDDVKVTGNN